MVNIGRLLIRPSNRVRRTAVVATPAAVMLVLGLWGIDRGGMWRDEAVTFQVARRSVPQIWRLLHDVDAVHGLYYLVMHAVLALRPGEVLLRLPSVCGAAAAAALVAALGARLVGPRAGLWAGLLYAITPMVGHYAQEGRSYALVAAGAAGATLLLVRAVDRTPGSGERGGRERVGAAGRRGRGGRGWWVYGAVLGVTCLLHEFAVLLLLAHAVTLALARVACGVWCRWVCAAGAVVLALLPMALVSHAQSAQVSWLREPDLDRAQALLRAFAGPTPAVYWTCLALAVPALTRLVGRRGEITCAAVALPLAVVPPVTLMLASRFSPLYVDRYVLYALAGVPLLVAAGADRVAGWLGRSRSGSPLLTLAGVLAVAVALVHQLPLLRADRFADHRPDNLAAVSRVAARELRPGDPVLFVPGQTRATALAYPAGFRGMRDVALAAGASASGTLYGTEVDAKVLRRRLAALDRVWVVADRYAVQPPRRPRNPLDRLKLSVVSEQFVLREQSARDRVLLRLYVRRTLVTDGPVAQAAPPVPRRPGRW
ncbi:glycosyltransferase family 39 protein [Streptomyces shenzhenensis]|uniref:glycosyltransferase family 39 protein n=1 Tax=Streptomyces shenzhenensis TaxID=943815 RepID=UPI0033DE531F